MPLGRGEQLDGTVCWHASILRPPFGDRNGITGQVRANFSSLIAA
jgi:hypothetical protein